MHVDPELLALLALDEPAGTEDEREHAATCPECSGEVAELRRVVGLARTADALALVEPGPQVWAAVSVALATASAAASDPQQELRSYARLTPVVEPWSQATGEAELGTDAKGRRLLQVTLHADLPAAGLRQAWLVHRHDPGRRQTLGILDGENGLWTVERAIDLEQFPILEISQQDIGSTEHSGQTIVRGELQPA